MSVGWLIITRDSRIARNRAEIAAVRDSEARIVALAGPEAVGTWAQLETLCCQWRAIGRRLDDASPFIYSATRTALRPVSVN
jgi:PIN like domain